MNVTIKLVPFFTSTKKNIKGVIYFIGNGDKEESELSDQ